MNAFINAFCVTLYWHITPISMRFVKIKYLCWCVAQKDAQKAPIKPRRMSWLWQWCLYESDVKRRNTLSCLDQKTCKVLRLWNSQDCETVCVYKYVQRMETMKESGLWSSICTHGSLVAIWWSCISSSCETRKFDFLSQIWPWGSKSSAPQHNKDLNPLRYFAPLVQIWWP